MDNITDVYNSGSLVLTEYFKNPEKQVYVVRIQHAYYTYTEGVSITSLYHTM